MNNSPRLRHLALFLLLLTSIVLTSSNSIAQVERVLYGFASHAVDGKYPMSGLVFDKTGAAYGTTSFGGIYGAGTVFRLTPPLGKGAWAETVLYNFLGTSDGADPYGGVILDGAGAIYGETVGGGTGTCFYQNINGCGVVYKLTPATSGGTWTESVIYAFTGGSDGGDPLGSLTLSPSGALYGTALFGGAIGGGVVFEIQPSLSGAWSERVLHSFGSTGDGSGPAAGVVFDKFGNLWGTTSGGGQSVYWGTVFRMSPMSSGQWQEDVLFSFTNGEDGGLPAATLTFDAKGNAYSTTLFGGKAGGGTVFQLSPPASRGGIWTESVLYSFLISADGATPEGGVIFDNTGNLYGTAHGGGESFAGVVFKLTPSSTSWTETVVYAFTNGADGGLPSSSLVFGPRSLLYGTSYSGGPSFGGTVFAVHN